MNKKAKKTEKQYKKSIEVFTTTKKITLEGVKTLRAERFTTKFNVIKEVHPLSHLPYKTVLKEIIDEKVEPLSFDLTEVTPEELNDYRNKGIPSFVLKFDGKLYHCSIPDNINLVSSHLLGSHKCAAECHRLSAATDEEGGCEKVRNRSNNIEKYPWITRGYETFNTAHNCFVVAACEHYEKCPPRKRRSTSEINDARLTLAQFYWDDVTSLAEVRERREKKRKFSIN